MTTETVTTTANLGVKIELAVGAGGSYPYWIIGVSRVGAGAWWPAPPEERGYAFVDVSAWVRGRIWVDPGGRKRLLEGFEAGNANFYLDNIDDYGGQWAPHNPDSPWRDPATDESTLRPGAVVRISAVRHGQTKPIFTGLVTGWDVFDNLPASSLARVEAVSMFRAWSSYDGPEQTGQGTGETVDARLERIAAMIGWEATRLDLQAGINTLQSTVLAGNALTMARLASDSDAGELYDSPDGRIVWRNRRHRFTATRSTTTQWSIANGPGRNLLTNGTLDTLTGATISSWTTSGTVAVSATAARGLHAAQLSASASVSSATAAVTAGLSYLLTVAANGTGDLTADVEWRDAGASLLSTTTTTLASTGPGTWDWHRATVTAPASAVTATVVLTASASGAITVDAVSFACETTNLLTNPGFEDDTSFSTGWTVTAGSGTCTADTDYPAAGNTSAKLSSSSGTPPILVSPAVTVTPAQVLQVAFAARGTAPLSVRVDFFDAGAAALHQATIETPDGTWEPGPLWSTLTAQVTVPASAATAKLRFTPTVAGDVWVDACVLAVVGSTGELLTNGGFETLTGTAAPYGWTLSGAVVASSTTPTGDGWGVSIPTGAHMDNGAAGAAIALDRPAVDHELVLQHRIGSGAPSLTVTVSWETAGDAAISADTTTVTPTEVWTRLRMALTPPTTAAKAWVRVACGATGAVLVDDVAFREDTSSAIPAVDLPVVADDSRLVTTAVVSHVGGTEQTYSDAAAVTANGGRQQTWRRNDLIMQTNAMALTLAEWVVRVGSQRAAARVDTAVIAPHVHDTAAALVCGADWGDRVALTAWRPGQDDPVVLDGWLEGATHEIVVGAGPYGLAQWRTTLSLSTPPDDAALVTL